MVKGLAIFELLIGIASGLAGFVLLASMFGISTPVWGARFFFYWGSLFAGPVLLIVGAVLLLIGVAPKSSGALTILGATVLSFWTVYLVAAMLTDQAQRGIDVGMIMIVATICVVAVAADFAAYKISRLVGWVAQ
jgi:hypothetical protein